MGQWKLDIHVYWQFLIGVSLGTPVINDVTVHIGPMDIHYSFEKEAGGVCIFKWFKNPGEKWKKIPW